MFQKGPGAGYMAAKAECLEHDASLTCKRVDGYYGVYQDGRCIGAGNTARNAWNEALGTLKTGVKPWLRDGANLMRDSDD